MLKPATVRAIRADVRRAFRATARRIARAVAPFEVLDSYGTRQHCYTMRAAAEWLPYCSPDAAIWNRWAGRTVARRWAA